MMRTSETGPEQVTPKEMRERLDRLAYLSPELVYRSDVPQGHVAAALAGRQRPLPPLLAMLEIREEGAGYADTREPEPEEPDNPTWPDGRPLSPEDEAELAKCVREALGRCRTPGRFDDAEHYHLTRALGDALETAGAIETAFDVSDERFSLVSSRARPGRSGGGSASTAGELA